MVSPPDAAKSAAIAGQATAGISAKNEERATSGASVPSPAADRADIRPLDVSGALQILISEVRAELDAMLLSISTGASEPVMPRADNPQVAMQSLVESLLGAYLKESQDFAAFSRAVSGIDFAWQSGSQRALELVGSWKEVPGSVVDSVREVIAGTGSLLDAENVNPAWLRAEWLGLAPKAERYRRRRRRLNRWLTDPDFKDPRLDDEQQPR